MAYFSPMVRSFSTNRVMISINDFKIASFEKKCDLLTSQTSSYIASRCDDEKKVYLYHSGKFFIEVFYSPLRKRVVLIHAFNDVKNLHPYAESVSLEDLTW